MEVVINITGYWKIWGKYHVHWYLRFIKNFITCFKNKQTCKILNNQVEMVYYMHEVNQIHERDLQSSKASNSLKMVRIPLPDDKLQRIQPYTDLRVSWFCRNNAI